MKLRIPAIAAAFLLGNVALCPSQAGDNDGLGLPARVVSRARQELAQLAALLKHREPGGAINANARTEILALHAALVDDLLEIAINERDNTEEIIKAGRPDPTFILGASPGRLAIEILGKIQAPQALPFLVRNVDYFEASGVSGYSPLQGAPCAIALSRFEMASVPPIFEYLAETDDPSDRQLELLGILVIYAYPESMGGSRGALAAVEQAAFRSKHRDNFVRLHDAMLAHLQRNRLFER